MTKEDKFYWLLDIKNNCLIEKAIECLDIVEFPGISNNPVIASWAEEVNAPSKYKEDKTPWCALFMSYIVHSCGYDLPKGSTKSLNWLEWGGTIEIPEIGDILIYKKRIGGHIGLFVEEDGDYYWTLGGNQSRKEGQDSVNIKRIKKSKCVRICRPIKTIKNEVSKD
jgi:uncharacterized protein (TIGR02594 family)